MTYHHLSVLVHRQAEKYGDKVALKYRDYETAQWIPISWKQFSGTVRQAANAFVALGVEEQENIGIFSQNKPEWFYVDFGAFANRAVTIPFYATSSPAQAQYIINDAQIRFLFVGEQYQYDAAFSIFGFCSSLQQLIIFDRSVVKDPRDVSSIYFDEFMATGEGLPHNDTVEERTERASYDDLANILYTSGTTGEPKGVMLHHSCYLEQFHTHDDRLTTMSDKDVSMNFLPLTHVFEKAWCYLCIHKGVQICINLRPADIQTTIKEIRPTLMCSVPRFWEKVYAGVQEKINETTGLKKALMLDAIRVGRIHNLDYLRLGKTPSVMNQLKYKFYEKTIYSLLKKTIGIENGNFFPTAGAAVPDEINEFVHSVGINMVVGYGLTESTATVSCTLPVGYDIGSVGVVLPGIEVKIGEDNEILLRGKTITKGYYKKAEATAAAIEPDAAVVLTDSIQKVLWVPKQEGLNKALERRADYQSAIMGIEMAKLQTDMARSKYLPQLAVGIKEKYGTTLLNVDGKAQWATTAYAQINIPVFHWGEMRQNVRLSRTQEWTKELERSQLKDQVSKELNNAWVNVIEISKKLEIVYSSLDIAKDNLTLNTFSYNEGKLPIIDVLSAQVSWLQAYTNVVSVNYQYKVALAEYAKALGGTDR